jgi:hypothetical protein
MNHNGIDIGCNVGNNQVSHSSHLLVPVLASPGLGASVTFTYQMGPNLVTFLVSDGNSASSQGWQAVANGVLNSGNFT